MHPLIIPFFIPHAGCPHTCLFCDQHTISGEQLLLPSAERITATVEEWLVRSPGRTAEVAYYGGSFTLLPRPVQATLLGAVQPFIRSGQVDGIRLSTRPDALDTDILQFLIEHQVQTIEIGVQSLDDEVLQRAGRGHTAQQSIEALQRTVAAGFKVGAQLLPGLPGDSQSKALASLHGVITAGAQFLRMYPAVVLSGTGLARLYQQGSYQPPDVDQGIRTCARLLHAAYQAGRPVIRIGLQADEGLVAGTTILAGCWHPALGQLVKGELYYDLVMQLSGQMVSSADGVVYCHPKRISEVRGHGQRNLQRWRQADLAITTVLGDPSLERDQLRLETMQQKMSGSIITTLVYKENVYA